MLVHRSILDVFTNLLIKKTIALKVGDPFSEDTRVGACISQDHMRKVAPFRFISSTLGEGVY